MATIRATCAICGDVQLTTDDVTVRVCTSNDEGEYRFRCPTCDEVVVRSAEQRTIDLLLAAGVEYSTWSLPAELFEERSGAPITHDDLIDFHELLSDDEGFQTLLGELDGA